MEAGTVVAHRYEIHALLGQGGMGRVFRAFDRQTSQTVAIKFLNPRNSLDDPTSIERFQREGEALRLLNHPNIVKVLATIEEGQGHCLVMELVEGGSLENMLRSRGTPLPVERVLALALDLSDALARAHRLGIVHRDIKPGNVLLALDGSPRLSDFGVAHIAGKERLSGSNALVGTLQYMSPETLAAEPVDARSDVWSFGVLLFEMLAGRCPFAAEHPAGLLHAILHAAPTDLETLRPDCPVELVDLIYRALEKNRHQRIPSVRRIGAELESLLLRFDPLRPRSDEAKSAAYVAEEPSSRAHAAEFSETETPSGPLGIPAALRVDATPFVGRESEIGELAQLLLQPSRQLVTIVGPGGTGKSRLALETSRRVQAGVGQFAATLQERAAAPTRAFFVELAPLSSVELIPSAIAEAVGFQFHPRGEPRAQLLDYLRAKRCLLVLDNFEHLLDGGHFVNELLQAAPGVQVLATSRERLGLSRENVFPLSGMGFPDLDSSAPAAEFSGVRLFAESARRVKIDFQLADDTTQEVARICRLVQGLPLAIVLAASWANVLTPGEIADEISKNFEFLCADLRDLPGRQRSMRAVFDYSYEVLGLEERTVFARLASFRGGFTRAAAELVAGASLRTMAALMNKSLVTRDPSSGRYRLHELLRQYAESRLFALPEERQRTSDAHADYYAAFLRDRTARLKGENPQSAVAEIESELDNVRAGWPRLIETQQLGSARAALEALRLFYSLRSSFAEAEQVFAAAAASFRSPEPEPGSERARFLARALSLQAHACRDQWRNEEAANLSVSALSLLDEQRSPGEAGHAWLVYALSSFWLGKVQAGLDASERALALYECAGDNWETVRALRLVGSCYDWIGHGRAEAYLRESIRLQQGRPDGFGGVPESLADLGDLLSGHSNYAEGCRLMREALALMEGRGDSWGSFTCRQNLARAERRLGNYADAEAHARQSLALARDTFPFAENWCRALLADVLKERGLLDEASVHYRASMADDVPVTIALCTLNLGDIALLRGDRAEAARALSQSLSDFERLDTRWGIVIACDSLGYLACVEERYAEASAYLQRALALSAPFGLLPLALNVLAGEALLQSRVGQAERAVELLTVVTRHPMSERQTLTRRVEPLLRELSSRLPALTFDAASARGQALEFEQVLRELAEARRSPAVA